MGSLGHDMWSSGSFGFALVHKGAPRGRRVPSGSRVFTWESGAPRGRLVPSG